MSNDVQIKLYFEGSEGSSFVSNQNIESFQLYGSFTDTSYDTLSLNLLSVHNPAELEPRTRPLQPVRLELNSRVAFIGRILSRSFGDDGTISIQCGDYRSDLVRSFVDPSIRINKGESLENTILKIVEPFGVTSIEHGFGDFKNAITPEANENNFSKNFNPSQLKVQQRKAENSEGAYEMLLRYCERAGCVPQVSDARTKLSLATPAYNQDATFWVRRENIGTDQGFSNVTSATLTEDYTATPSVMISTCRSFSERGQASKGTQKTLELFSSKSSYPLGRNYRLSDGSNIRSRTGSDEYDPGPIVQAGRVKPGHASDPQTAYFPLYIDSKESKTQEELDELVHKKASNALKSTFVLKYTFPFIGQEPLQDDLGNASTGYLGGIFMYDTIFHVKDDVFGINNDFYCSARTISYSSAQGTSASVDLIIKDIWLGEFSSSD